MNAPQKPRRLAMPEAAAFIDACREALGADQINPSLKNGAQCGSDFYASENGHTIGSPLADPRPPLEKTCRNCTHWQRQKMGATCNYYQPQD